MKEMTWEEEFERMNAINDRLYRKHGSSAVWSVPYKKAPSERLRAVEGRVRFFARGDDFFGGEESRNYLSRVYNNPSWETVYKEFARSLGHTRDFHHLFLEGIRKVSPIELKQEVVYEFVTGS